MNDIIATTLSQVLAENYIKETAAFVAKCVVLGGVGYVSVKLVDELKNKK